MSKDIESCPWSRPVFSDLIKKLFKGGALRNHQKFSVYIPRKLMREMADDLSLCHDSKYIDFMCNGISARIKHMTINKRKVIELVLEEK